MYNWKTFTFKYGVNIANSVYCSIGAYTLHLPSANPVPYFLTEVVLFGVYNVVSGVVFGQRCV